MVVFSNQYHVTYFYHIPYVVTNGQRFSVLTSGGCRGLMKITCVQSYRVPLPGVKNQKLTSLFQCLLEFQLVSLWCPGLASVLNFPYRFFTDYYRVLIMVLNILLGSVCACDYKLLIVALLRTSSYSKSNSPRYINFSF